MLYFVGEKPPTAPRCTYRQCFSKQTGTMGAVSEMDSPKKPNAEAKELDRRYFCGITDEMRAADRNALCSVDAALLKAQAAALSDALSSGVRVAFGSKDAVEAAKDLFDRVETL